MTIGQFKLTATKEIESTSPSPHLDIQVFLEYKLKYNKTRILLSKDEELSEENLSWLLNAVEQRKTGLPVAYITGEKEFFGYNFIVTKDVLIPKPDTEILVEQAINHIKIKIQNKPDILLNICDMCTGSGCIGLSVLKSLLDFGLAVENLPKVTMVDISAPALEVARKNFYSLFDIENLPQQKASILKSKVRFVQSNLFEFVPWKFEFILTNPPYIPHTLVQELLKDGRNEPVLALNGDVSIDGNSARKLDGSLKNDGLEIIRNMMPQLKEHLCRYGTVLMETGEYNAEDAAILAEKWGFKTRIHKDLEGQLRVVEMK